MLESSTASPVRRVGRSTIQTICTEFFPELHPFHNARSVTADTSITVIEVSAVTERALWKGCSSGKNSVQIVCIVLLPTRRTGEAVLLSSIDGALFQDVVDTTELHRLKGERKRGSTARRKGQERVIVHLKVILFAGDEAQVIGIAIASLIHDVVEELDRHGNAFDVRGRSEQIDFIS